MVFPSSGTRREANWVFARHGYLVVAPDQRGYNLSDKPLGIAPYRANELARDIVGLIDYYGRKKVFLVGYDWGGPLRDGWPSRIRNV